MVDEWTLSAAPSANSRHEEALVSLWDARGARVATMVMEGTASSLTLDLRAILWLMARTRATTAILAHIHPSGDPMPSRNDVEVTRRLWRAARLLGVRLHDHVIHGDGAQFSFRAAGLL
jgi:DNA repair protein RadC